MRKNIIQSKTEPNKNDIWLSEEGLKKYGKNGWEPLGGGGINDSTPVVNEVSGNELLPINVNGENKAVSAAALVKGAKELFVITPTLEGEFPTILTKDYLNSGMPVIFYAGTYIAKNFTRSVIDMDVTYFEDYYIVVPAFKSGEKAVVFIATYRLDKPNNPVSFIVEAEGKIIPLYYNGDGTKFLSDDGTYKEVSGGGEPVIIEIDAKSPTSILTDKQINAAKNSNIKIKAILKEENTTIIINPTIYTISNDSIIIDAVLAGINGAAESVKYNIDIINKIFSIVTD